MKERRGFPLHGRSEAETEVPVNRAAGRNFRSSGRKDAEPVLSGVFCLPKEDASLKNVMAIELVRKYFISAAIKIPVDSIRSVRLLNTFLRRRYRKQKIGIVDLLVELNDDTKINIELQVARYAFWDRRCLFYLSRMYTEELWSGEDYGKLKRCISISILDFNLTEDEENHKVYYLRDEEGKLFSDVFEIHTIELKKEPREDDPLNEWIRFFNATSEEELDMIQTKNPGLLEAIREIKRMGLGRRARLWHEAVLKERRDRNARDTYVRNEGMEIGRAEGMEAGLAKGMDQQLAMLIRIKREKGKSVKEIAEELEDTEAHIREIMEKMGRRDRNECSSRND